MGFSKFPHGVSSMGIPLLGASIPTTFGRVLFVDADYGNDGNDGKSMNYAVKTIAQGYSLMRDGYHDILCLAGGSNHALTAMLNVAKNKVHFIGLGVGNRRYGQRTRVTMGVTTAVTDIAIIANLGTGNTFHNIKFDNENTLTQAAAAVAEGGQYASYSNCEFYMGTHLNSNTCAELLLNGDSPQFFNCNFGSLADAVVGNVVRPSVYMAGGSIPSSYVSVSRDVYFDDCRFWKNAGGTGTGMIKITSDNDLERMMEFHDCVFAANVLGSVPAVAIIAPTLGKSQVLLTGDTVAVNCTKIGTATGIINCTPARVATATIGIQAT